MARISHLQISILKDAISINTVTDHRQTKIGDLKKRCSEKQTRLRRGSRGVFKGLLPLSCHNIIMLSRHGRFQQFKFHCNISEPFKCLCKV
ncbi:hypothetical protein HanRHA438_Chr05g0214181 [Helianthus annuus]|nr:hypothetical protein HanRHA438_Chr05g0214181 [Helianthus annuus]